MENALGPEPYGDGEALPVGDEFSTLDDSPGAAIADADGSDVDGSDVDGNSEVISVDEGADLDTAAPGDKPELPGNSGGAGIDAVLDAESPPNEAGPNNGGPPNEAGPGDELGRDAGGVVSGEDEGVATPDGTCADGTAPGASSFAEPPCSGERRETIREASNRGGSVSVRDEDPS